VNKVQRRLRQDSDSVSKEIIDVDGFLGNIANVGDIPDRSLENRVLLFTIDDEDVVGKTRVKFSDNFSRQNPLVVFQQLTDEFRLGLWYHRLRPINDPQLFLLSF